MDQPGWSATKQALARPGRASGMIVAAVPTVVFVAVNALSSMHTALVAAAGAAAAGFLWRLARRQPRRDAIIGLLTVCACATVASVTGDARGFFLLPALFPFVVVAACVVSILVRRPLTGLLLNRVSGGPADWFKDPRLRHVYSSTTLAAAGVDVMSAALQAFFYLRSNTFVLAAAHVGTGPVFAVIMALTIVLARRATAKTRTLLPVNGQTDREDSCEC